MMSDFIYGKMNKGEIMIKYDYFWLWILFSFVNFAIQIVKNKPDYKLAWTISYFQAAPILYFYMIN